MNKNISNAAKTFGGAKLLKGFRLSWLVYGAAAYYGLKFLNKKGIMPKQTDAALGLMDKGIDFAKGQVGLKQSPTKSALNKGDSVTSQVRH